MSIGRAGTFIWAGLAATAVIASLLGLWLAVTMVGGSTAQPQVRATYLEGGRPVEEFELVDHAGKPFDPARLRGQWTILTFGYTHCPDHTPETLSALAMAYRTLEEIDAAQRLHVALLTVDPQRDQRQQLADYVTEFHPDFLGVTGDRTELERLATSIGVRFRADGDGRALITVEPAATAVLIDPRGQLVALFNPPHHPQLIARDLHLIFEHERGSWLQRLGDR